jgi:fatty acyl-ACP thioesterase B
MAASVASSAFFPVPASAPKNAPGRSKDNLDMGGVAANVGAVRSSSARARAHAAVPKVNSGGKAAVTDGEDDASRSSAPAPAPRTFYNQLPDWSVLLAAITTIFLAAERQWTLVDWKPKRPDMLIDTFGFNGQVFRQDFSIRSYEIGADRTASIETLMNHLQVSHVRQ